MRLDVFYRKEDKDNFYIKKSLRRRQWMDDTPSKFAYHCLPLTIANMYGWTIFLGSEVEAEWDGGHEVSNLDVKCDDPYVACSNFGSGILTFTPSFLIRTEEDYDLFVIPVPNRFKHGIQALSGIIETTWIPYTFTINWKFTKPGKIKFSKDEPLANFFPILKHQLEEFDPHLFEHRELDIKSKIEESKWSNERRFRQNNPELRSQHLYYYRGVYSDGEKIDGHETRLRHKEFKNG